MLCTFVFLVWCLQVLQSIMQVFLAEPLGEWQKEGKTVAQLAQAAEADSTAAPGAAQAAARQAAGVADLKVGASQHTIIGAIIAMKMLHASGNFLL